MKKLLILALAFTALAFTAIGVHGYTPQENAHIKNVVALNKPLSYKSIKTEGVIVLTMFFKDRVEVHTLQDGFTLDVVQINGTTVLVYPRESE
jgi:hypothetical protein